MNLYIKLLIFKLACIACDYLLDHNSILFLYNPQKNKLISFQYQNIQFFLMSRYHIKTLIFAKFYQ